MAELEITICSGNPQEDLKTIVQNYQHETRVSVDLRYIEWERAWTEFLQMTLYGRGPVISEVGTTWMSSLAGRNSLRPMSKDELRKIGGAGSFPHSIWESCIDASTQGIVAIPWIVDTYLVYYRADILENAGVDESKAFSTLDEFHKTLETLKAKNVEMPIALATAPTLSTTHNIASWIWGMGGDFVSRDGTSLTLGTSEAREGINYFYELNRFISPKARGLSDEQCEEAFLNGEAAVVIFNPVMLHRLKNRDTQPAFRNHIKTAVHPGVPIIGGSNLVIWKYIPPALEPQAVDFIRYMLEVDAQTAYFEASGMLPARLDAVQRISLDPDYGPAFQTLLSGRDVPYIRLWGLVEDRLSQAFSKIWSVILESPEPDIKKIIDDVLKPIENRLNITLSQ